MRHLASLREPLSQHDKNCDVAPHFSTLEPIRSRTFGCVHARQVGLDPFKKLHAQVLREESRHLDSLMASFNLLERHDPTLVALVLKVMGERDIGARWMASSVAGLADRMPYALLAEGRTDELVKLLMESIG
jgi:hypothetical protein